MKELLTRIQSADGMFSVDRGQRIAAWNPAAEEILGLAAKDVLGRPCYDVIGGRESQNFRFCRRDCPIFTNARRGRATADYDVVTRTGDGRDIWINISIVLLREKKGRPPHVVHLFRDVTERRRVEGLARRAMDTLLELGGDAEEGGAVPDESDTRLPPLPSLSRRELQVLQLLGAGMETGRIADHLSVSPITARNHITRVVSKLGARNRLQAVLYASRRNLI